MEEVVEEVEEMKDEVSLTRRGGEVAAEDTGASFARWADSGVVREGGGGDVDIGGREARGTR